MRALMDVPALVAIVRGPDHVYEFANHAYVRSTRLTPPLVGTPFGRGTAAVGLQDLVRRLDEVRATGIGQRMPELKVAHPGQPERWYDVRFEPIRDESGAVDGVLLQSVDITDQIIAREKLIQVQKLEGLGVLAGGIAHDFNNLLAVIVGSTQAAMQRLPEGSPATKSLDGVLLGARRATELTRQLLAYAGKGHVEVKPVNLSDEVRELTTLLQATVPKKVDLCLELAPGLPAVEADIAQVQQIVMNLVVNGAEAIGDGRRGVVSIATGTADGATARAATYCSPASGGAAPGANGDRYVFLEVTDTGCGMDEATTSRIFDPFFTTKPRRGRGLGLAAVLGIVRGHEGALDVKSSVGAGTTFKVYLPASARPVETPRRAYDPVDTFRGAGAVLVIDDDSGVRMALRMLLEHFGFDVVEAADGRAGVLAFEARPAAWVAIVLDMTMPELGGEEVFERIRVVRDDVPVIISSGYDEDEAARLFASKGLAAFLPKPFTAEQLATRLRAALGPAR
jgi:signal transduction histidine kinase/CheY-like chemotaxis protein